MVQLAEHIAHCTRVSILTYSDAPVASNSRLVTTAAECSIHKQGTPVRPCALHQPWLSLPFLLVLIEIEQAPLVSCTLLQWPVLWPVLWSRKAPTQTSHNPQWPVSLRKLWSHVGCSPSSSALTQCGLQQSRHCLSINTAGLAAGQELGTGTALSEDNTVSNAAVTAGELMLICVVTECTDSVAGLADEGMHGCAL